MQRRSALARHRGSHPASYSGSSDGRILTLSLTPEGAEALGPFELELWRPPRLFKCR